jgi:hypothetical protein
VTLDGSQSTGVTGYSWSQTGGPIVALTGATTAKPTFTMPNTNDSLIFQLTVTGPGGSDYAVVQISPRPDVLTVDQAEYRRNGAEWRISGTASIVTTNTVTIYVVNGTTRTKLGTATVDALGVWSLRLGNSTVVPTTTSRLAVESTRGGILTGITIFIRN